MKLIALAIFLLSISSNAFAKVEIWECEVLLNEGEEFNGIILPYRVFKIDTKNLSVHYRDRGKWRVWFEVDEPAIKNITYDKNNDSLIVYWKLIETTITHSNGEEEEIKFEWTSIFDFVAKRYLKYEQKDDLFSFEEINKHEKCKVIG